MKGSFLSKVFSCKKVNLSVILSEIISIKVIASGVIVRVDIESNT